MKKIFLAVLSSFLLSFICGKILLPLLKKLKAGQPILKYVETHKNKNGTPTMGGLFFIIPTCIVYILFFGFNNRIAIFSICISLAYLIVGFIDDFLKIKYKQNEGLKAYQKILFQLSISIVAGVFVYRRDMTKFFLPFSNKFIDLKIVSILVVIVVFLAITNSVNLTDGLDGLAGNSSLFYLIFLSLIIHFENVKTPYLYSAKSDVDSLIALSCCLIGALSAFLLFNTGKASVFMGDTGSLALGGFIGCLSVFSLNSFIIPFLGIVFVFSVVSVIIQVFCFKKTGKRVFLMSPFHHHLQLKGYTESKISYLYSLITCIMGVLLIISYL